MSSRQFTSLHIDLTTPGTQGCDRINEDAVRTRNAQLMSGKRRAYPQPAYNPALAGPGAAPPLAGATINGAGTPPLIQQDQQQQQYAGQQPFQGVQSAAAGITPVAGTPYDLASGMQGLNINQQPQQASLQMPAHQYAQAYPSQYGAGTGMSAPPPVNATPMNELYTVDLLTELPPPIIDLQFPPPPVNLSPTATVTQSPEANASSDYIRSTLNVVPNTSSLLKKSKLPFALSIHPYTSLTDEEAPVPVINDGIITRCRRCRSYLNPFVEIKGDGRWRCNFCALLNDLPSAIRSNHFNRFELNHGVVEFLATNEYMVRAPQSLNYMFIIDVSANSIKNGLLSTTIRTILDSLDRIPNDQGRANVSFIAVDSKLSFFSIPPDDAPNSDIQMMVVSSNDDDKVDDDIIIPAPDNLICNLKACRANIEKLLNNFTSYFVNNMSTEFNLSTALKSGHKLLEKIGGKMVVISSTLPNKGKGKLIIRDEKSVAGTSKESTSLLTANNSFYKSFAIDCNKCQITVDMFLTSSSYQDVATLSNLPKFTAGQTHFYPAWSAMNLEDITKLSNELSNHLSMEVGLEAVMRVRCSDGVKGHAYFGNFFSRSSDLLSFPSFARDQSYIVELSIDADIRRETIYFQTAVLHTSCHGDRRIRVITAALPVSNNLNHVYASADQLAIAAYLTQISVEKALSHSFESARDYINKTILDILTTYKKEIVASNLGSSSPLQISTNLRMLPLLLQSLLKHIGLRDGIVPSDHRANAINKLTTLPIHELIQYIYPSVYSLHDMEDECGLPYEGEDDYDEIIPKLNGEIVIPECINASVSSLQRYGLYLIQSTTELFLYLGGDSVPQLVEDVFGVSSLREVRVGKTELPELDNEFNIRVRNIINKLRVGKGSIRYESLHIVVGPGANEKAGAMGDIDRSLMALRMWCMSVMVEDRTQNVLGYREFLGQLRDKVHA